MATYTENYNLKKPATTDPVNIEDLNGNADIIDAALAGKADAADVSGKYTKPETGIPATDLDAEVQASLDKADTAVQASEKGATNGVATLDGAGKVPAAQLPSYGMQADWEQGDNNSPDYVKNRTHYLEKTYTQVLSQATTAYSGSSFGYIATGTLSEQVYVPGQSGNDYEVTFNGQKYRGSFQSRGGSNTYYTYRLSTDIGVYFDQITEEGPGGWSYTFQIAATGSVPASTFVLKKLSASTYHKLNNAYLDTASSPSSGSNKPLTAGGAYTALANKVDKEAGKGLSTNDYTNEDKQALAAKYEKPEGGIPASDLSADVQTSLDKAENSLQAALDETLTVQGAAADAKATGEAIGDVKSALSYTNKETEITAFESGTYDGSGNPMAISTRIRAGKYALTKGNSLRIETNGQFVQVLAWNGSSYLGLQIETQNDVNWICPGNYDVAVIVGKIGNANITTSDRTATINLSSYTKNTVEENKADISLLKLKTQDIKVSVINPAIYQGGANQDGSYNAITYRCRSELIFMPKGTMLKVIPGDVAVFYTIFDMNKEVVSGAYVFDDFTKIAFNLFYPDDCYVLFTFKKDGNANLVPSDVDTVFKYMVYSRCVINGDELNENNDYIEYGAIDNSGNKQLTDNSMVTKRFFVPDGFSIGIQTNNNIVVVSSYQKNGSFIGHEFIYQDKIIAGGYYYVVSFQMPSYVASISKTDINAKILLVSNTETNNDVKAIVGNTNRNNTIKDYYPAAVVDEIYNDSLPNGAQLQAIGAVNNLLILGMPDDEETESTNFLVYNLLTGKSETVDTGEKLGHCNSIAYKSSTNMIYVAPYSDYSIYHLNNRYEVVGRTKFEYMPQGVCYNRDRDVFAVMERENDRIHIYNNDFSEEITSFTFNRNNTTYKQDIECDNCCIYITHFSSSSTCFISVYDFYGNFIKRIAINNAGECEGLAIDLWGNMYCSYYNHDTGKYSINNIYIEKV